MSMTRTDFDAIAAIVREYKLLHYHANEDPVYVLTTRLSKYFKKVNPTFDKGKFLKNCGYYQEG